MLTEVFEESRCADDMAALFCWMVVIGQLEMAAGYWRVPPPPPPTKPIQHVGTWPNAIVPYEISSEFTYPEYVKIISAIGDLHRFSCVRWVPRHQATTTTKDYVYITPGERKKCSSHVGRVGIGRQTLQLAPHCFQRSTILHELMHSLGFHHEHARRDRDSYIRILWHNVNPNHTVHFKVHNMGEHTYSTPYDYLSVMHYDSLMGTGTGGPTILKHGSSKKLMWGLNSGLDLDREMWIKPAESLSLMDAARLNMLYQCDTRVCMDMYPFCRQYVRMGACYQAPQYMNVLCKRSCGSRC